MGLSGLRERLAALGGALTIDTAPGAGSRLVARGMSNREIADALTIAEGTVKSHVSNILPKLHPAHRTQAALYALRYRLVSLDDPRPREEPRAPHGLALP